MYSREFPSGNFLLLFSSKMNLFRLPCSKLTLAFLAVPAGKDGWVECPLAVSARRSFIVPTATMTVHPVRHSGVILGVPQTMRSFEQMQQRITGFVAAHSGMTEKRYTDLMLHTGELVMDMGTVLDGRRAVKEKLIDELGGLSDALAWLYKEIERK